MNIKPMKIKKIPLAIALVMAAGFGYWQLIYLPSTHTPMRMNQQAAVDDKRTLLSGDVDQVERALQKGSGQLIQQDQRSYIEGALPPGGDELVNEIAVMNKEIQQLLNEPEVDESIPSEKEILAEIAASYDLIAKVDAEHGLDTPAFLDQMLEQPVAPQTEELKQLDQQIELLDKDVETLLRNAQ